jgi:hypothetical protein
MIVYGVGDSSPIMGGSSELLGEKSESNFQGVV